MTDIADAERAQGITLLMEMNRRRHNAAPVWDNILSPGAAHAMKILLLSGYVESHFIDPHGNAGAFLHDTATAKIWQMTMAGIREAERLKQEHVLIRVGDVVVAF